jgi:hypothetical protein
VLFSGCQFSNNFFCVIAGIKHPAIPKGHSATLNQAMIKFFGSLEFINSEPIRMPSESISITSATPENAHCSRGCRTLLYFTTGVINNNNTALPCIVVPSECFPKVCVA